MPEIINIETDIIHIILIISLYLPAGIPDIAIRVNKKYNGTVSVNENWYLNVYQLKTKRSGAAI